jgi:Xaa-Pro aminopeptidase
MLQPEIAAARQQALRKGMLTAGLDALILASRPQLGQRGAVRFLTDFHVPSRAAYVVLFPEGTPQLLTLNKAEQYIAQEASGFDKVHYALDAGEGLASIIKSSGGSMRTIGIAGLKSTMSFADYESLTQRCPGIKFVDATRVFDAARVIKSEAEIAQIRQSYAVADAVYRTYLDFIKPGIEEIELHAEAERTLRLMGACDSLIFVTSGPTNLCVSSATRRRLQRGDLVTLWIEVAGPDGFWVERGGMVSLGPPTDEGKMLFDVTLDATLACGRALRTGAKASEAAAPVKQVGLAAGLNLGVWSGHGIGLDVIEPPSIVSDDDTVLEEGMAISVHPHVLNKDKNNGGHIGDVYIVRDGGGEPLSRMKHELHIID